jgi:hypothetical protein
MGQLVEMVVKAQVFILSQSGYIAGGTTASRQVRAKDINALHD